MGKLIGTIGESHKTVNYGDNTCGAVDYGDNAITYDVTTGFETYEEKSFSKEKLKHLRDELFKISLEIINPYCSDCKRLDDEINKLLSYCDKLLKELEEE